MNEARTYAQFWKCALRVNPHACSGNYRGREHGMDSRTYAGALRDVCRAEGIGVVGFAGHDGVADAEVARKLLTESGIVVFLWFELLTTEKVHWVCLFLEDTSERQLERYLGKLHLTDPRDGARPSDLGGQELLAAVDALDGFCYVARVTSKCGVLKGELGHLWTDSRLRAARIPGKVEDLPPRYESIALNHDVDYRREHRIALINAKDVAAPEDLRDARASTFIKMTRPCFASFLMAFVAVILEGGKEAFMQRKEKDGCDY